MREFIIKYWLQVLFSGMLTFLGYMVRKISDDFKREKNEQKLLKEAMQAMLRDRLIQVYNHYTEKGYMSIHNRDNVLNMYDKYHKLGENGVMNGLMDELKALPVSKKDI